MGRSVSGCGKILVVDDELHIRRYCSDILSNEGYVVDTASDGLEALEKFKTTAYDLVISDIKMPSLSGVDFLRSILKDHAELKERFMFITAELTPPARSIISEMHIKYLIKPFKVADLVTQVSSLLHHRGSGH